jgi:hypothetical protein
MKAVEDRRLGIVEVGEFQDLLGFFVVFAIVTAS